MATYRFTAKVRRVVTDDVSMTVRADNEQLALECAESVLQDEAVDSEKGNVPFCYIENRKTDEIEIIDIEPEESEEERA